VSGAGPETAALYRCAYALPLLGLLARREGRAYGPADRRTVHLALVAGVLFAADLVVWAYAIEDVGAGLATVLGNLQVVIVPLVALALLGERPSRAIVLALPVMLAGVVLISGALERGAYGDDPARGVVLGVLTGLAYAGFILVLRQAGSDVRRPAGTLFVATASATLVALLAGLAVDPADLVPRWPAHGWLVLLALSSQVVAWMLITSSLPRLPAALTSVTLTIQPLGSVLLGVVLLGEDPSGLQLAGAGCILVGLIAATTRR
jgi:drug/metabolite transporter (DMT)-like permease